jgi:DNA-binding NarL/FixJ family response regulator
MHKDRIRLVLLDDYGLFRTSLARFLASEADFDVVGESDTSAQGLEILCGSPVDIVLLDFNLESDHANDFIAAARKAGYQGRFLIVTGAPDIQSSVTVLKLGASGIFLRSEAPERLVQAVKTVASGAVWLDPKILQLLADQCLNQSPRRLEQVSMGVLGSREQKVLLGVLDGLTNRKIADCMSLSESSVKNTLQRLFSKTGVRKRSQLVQLALKGSLGNII